MLILLFIVLVFNIIAISIPKKLSGIELFTTILFAACLQLLTDLYLDVKYQWYGYFYEGVDWKTLIYIIGIYPAATVIYLNLFPHTKSISKKVRYILIWSILSLVFEVIFVWSGTFYYNGWKLWYSAFAYPFLLTILVLGHRYTRFLLSKFHP